MKEKTAGLSFMPHGHQNISIYFTLVFVLPRLRI